MKSFFKIQTVVLFILSLVASEVNAQNKLPYSPQIEPYVDYLSKTYLLSAKDFVLSLFDTHDIVVICERHHCDTTQYDFIWTSLKTRDL
ncbi:hypothetical protein FACS1894201_01490 [Bacteroidia bacterium]|nr:hypothetical protein FACS1894201_01490 [Bacteroidia bacterium]